MASERLPSGVPGLDEVLDGGLPVNAINLIAGLPGTGKTLIAQQCVFSNATPENPAVYLSTLSEPFEKIIRYGQTLSFFEAEVVGRHVFYEDLASVLLKDGLRPALARIEQILNDHEPRFLVIDSFRPFATVAESRSEYRRFLHELAAGLSVRPITSLWLGEYAVGDMAGAPEFAIADAVIWLTAGRYEQREMRLLQVLKLRGSGFRSGKHAYRLSAHGMRVFPRLADPAEQAPYRDDRNDATAPNVLDPLVGSGHRSASSTLVVGPSGSGKTVLGMQFAFEAVRKGRGALFATFDENPSQIATAAGGFGWSFDRPEIRLMYRSPVDLHLDEWVYDLLERVEPSDIARVFIDGLGNLRTAAHDPTRFQEYLYSLVQRFARAGLTIMMSLESPELFGATRLMDVPLSQVADNVLLLQFLRREGEYRRGVTVLKSRTAKTAPRLNEYTIGADGIQLTRPEGLAEAR